MSNLQDFYPEKLPVEKEQPVHLDLTNTPLIIYSSGIDPADNEAFAMSRKEGFGGSDSGALLGVSPYKTREELIQEKARLYLTAEEKAIGQKTSVIMGNDLEPLLINKFQSFFGMKTVKPTDMYMFKDYPYLKMNFDGVTGSPKQYYPSEIKVVSSKASERHYRPIAAIFDEVLGWKPLPENVSERNWSIEDKAYHYGIPPYYYTQLQQEIMGLNAPFGFLSTIHIADWSFHTYFAWRDRNVVNAIIIEGAKAWEKVEILRQRNGMVYDGTDQTY